ncbi:MAG: iron ABC transporter permease, partial [Candidatus Thorarchaeota archaeon]|nr:iron ABC transporter permease [Candidatus Thorarchaeota archaeon]
EYQSKTLNVWVCLGFGERKGMNRQSVIEYAILSIPFILLTLFLIYPVLAVLFQGLTVGPGSTFFEVVNSIVTQRIVSFTLTQALLSTIIAMLIGLPGAFVLAKIQFKGKSILRSFLIVPFVLPPIVVVVGFLQMFGSGGLLDVFFMAILGTKQSVLDLATGYVGIVLAHAFYNIPLFLLIVSAALERLNPEIEEVAEILGASSAQKLRRIVIPHIRSSIVAASVLTFLFCFMSFPIVLALGEGSFITMEVQIWNAFRFFDYGEASSLALLQILITLILAYTYLRIGASQDSVAGSTSYIKTHNFSNLSLDKKGLTLTYLGILLFLSIGPMAAIVRAAFYNPITDEITLQGFFNLVDPGLDGGLFSFVNSIFYASLATIFSLVLGTILAYTNRSRVRSLPMLKSIITLLPLGVSAITIAYGLMLTIAVPLGLSTNPWFLIVIAQTLIGIPFSARAIEIAHSKIDPAIIEQAESLGASKLQRLFFVELPLLTPGLIVGAVFSFAMAIGEMSATIFLATPETSTLAITIYRDLAIRKFVEAGAAALVLVAFCVIAFLVIERFSENGYGGTL